MVMNVPVRPTPALREREREREQTITIYGMYYTYSHYLLHPHNICTTYLTVHTPPTLSSYTCHAIHTTQTLQSVRTPLNKDGYIRPRCYDCTFQPC